MELTYTDNAAQLSAAAGLFIGTLQLALVLLVTWFVVAFVRSRFDP
jgi:cadmium resistance protein CadD (predicted permease)